MNGLFKNTTDIEIINSTITCIQLGIGKNTEKPYMLVRDHGEYNVTKTNRQIVARRMRDALVKLNTMMYKKFGIEDYVGSYFPNWQPMIDKTTPGGYVKHE